MTFRMAHLLAAGFVMSMAQGAFADETPDLVGIWSGKAVAVHIGTTPYRDKKSDGVIFGTDPIEFTYNITEQKGDLFAGEMTALGKKETLIGSLQPNHKGGIMLDDDGQYQFTLTKHHTIDICYSHSKPDSKVVACWTLTKAK